MQIEPLFPQAIIGLNKLKVDHNKVLKYLKNIEFETTNPAKEKKEAEKAYVSKNFNIFKDLSYLKNEIYINVKNYLNNIMKLKTDFQFTTSWATKTLPNGYSQKHLHSNSFLSGVYYPIGDKNFSIKFYKKNNFWYVETIEDNNLNATWYSFKIIDNGILILFPSNLKHSVEKNLSKKTRYSIAFNTLPFGEIGKSDSKVNFK
jgi:uncharacterized protein (TIGR02466 family)